MQSSPVTIRDIHEALSKRMHLEVSRRTVERDILEMEDMGMISIIPGIPAKYYLNKAIEVDIRLKVEEVQAIVQQIDPRSEIFFKLHRLMT
jgi:predicted DNA-binding transcriptional regulator YafY